MIHADTFSLCVFGKRAVEALREAELELTRIALIRLRLSYIHTLFQRSLEPSTFCISSILYNLVQRVAACDASRKIRIARCKSPFIGVGNDLQPVGQIQIVINLLHGLPPRLLRGQVLCILMGT